MSNYSFETSLPAYNENKDGKNAQADLILKFVEKKGQTNLKEIEDELNITQSTVAARVNELIKDNKVIYEGKEVYKGRKRKIIVYTPVFKD